MFQSQFIEVGIGLVFVFLLMSIMVSGLNEVIVAIFDRRGKHLKDSIDLALKDPVNKNWVDHLYNHPLVDSLKKTDKKLPAYISAAIFSKSLIDIISQEKESVAQATVLQSKANPVQNFTDGVNTLRSSPFKMLLGSFINDANGDYEKLKINIESWYSEYMNRVSGWYKRQIRRNLLIMGLIFAVAMNVDTVRISKTLWENAVLRESVANAAEGFAAANKDSSLTRVDSTFEGRISTIKSGYDKLGMLNLPIGWGLTHDERHFLSKHHHHQHTVKNYWDKFKIFCSRISISALIGWIFTGIAISFGAPMWFDMLNKLINLRHSAKGPEKK